MVCSCSVVGFFVFLERKREKRECKWVFFFLCLADFFSSLGLACDLRRFVGQKKNSHFALARSILSILSTSSTDRRSLVDAALPLARSERGAKGGFESDCRSEKREGKKKKNSGLAKEKRQWRHPRKKRQEHGLSRLSCFSFSLLNLFTILELNK